MNTCIHSQKTLGPTCLPCVPLVSGLFDFSYKTLGENDNSVVLYPMYKNLFLPRIHQKTSGFAVLCVNSKIDFRKTACK